MVAGTAPAARTAASMSAAMRRFVSGRQPVREERGLECDHRAARGEGVRHLRRHLDSTGHGGIMTGSADQTPISPHRIGCRAVTTTITETLTKPTEETTDRGTDDTPKMFHYVRKTRSRSRP